MELKYAHEIEPHPKEGEPTDLTRLVRYHYAQAQAWLPSFSEAISANAYGADGCDFTLSQYVGHAHRALLCDALAQGLAGQEAADWASVRNHSESGEWAWERGAAYGLDPDEIRPYEWRHKFDRTGV